MAEEGDLAASLGAAFGDPPPPEPVVEAPETPEAEAQVEAEAPADDVEAAPQEEEAVAEPEFEIEVDGQRETVRGQEAIKELLQKGKHYSKNAEINARVREQLVAQAQAQQLAGQFQQTFLADIAELRAFDSQLEQWNRVDFAAAFEADPFNAMKLKEQRDSLREARSAKLGEIQQKQQHFQQGQAQATQQAMAAETNALLAKLPEWRNSEKAQTEKQQLSTYLTTQGFSDAEVQRIADHRGVILARKAMLYDQLQSGKAGMLKQVRTAPPVVKPGTKVTTNGKIEFQKVAKQFRTMGQKGNHRAQEDVLTSILNRTFK